MSLMETLAKKYFENLMKLPQGGETSHGAFMRFMGYPGLEESGIGMLADNTKLPDDLKPGESIPESAILATFHLDRERKVWVKQ